MKHINILGKFSHCTDVCVEAGEYDKILCVCLNHLEDDGKADGDEDDDNDGDGNDDEMVVIFAFSTSSIKSNQTSSIESTKVFGSNCRPWH